MNLLELHLKAFGPFTDRRLILSEGASTGLCVVYGPNEAGKSSVLRAVHDLLYGIPVRSSDNFLHEHPKMRVGGRLLFSQGEELAIMRRKATKQSVYDYADKKALQPEAIALLTAVTEAVPEETFNRFYGLDRRRLADGSRDLFDDGGEVGRALLGARLGVGSLRPVLEGLEEEAAALFSARGSKPLINAGLKAWKETESEIKASALEPREWQAQSKAVEEAEAALAELDAGSESERAQLVRLERVHRALPSLAKRTVAIQRLAESPEVTPLPDDYEARLIEARATVKDATLARKRSESRIEQEQARRERLVRAPLLLAERERIESLHQRVDGYRNSLKDLPRRERELAAIELEIDGGVRSFGAAASNGEGGGAIPSPARMRVLHQAVGRAGRVEDLASEFAKFGERLEKATEERATARAEIERLIKQETAVPPNVDRTALQAALTRARKLGGLDERIEDEALDLVRREEECARRARALGLAVLGDARLENLHFPEADVITNADRRFADLEQRETRAEETRAERSAAQRSVAEDLARLRGEGAVPSEQDLDAARHGRDLVWRTVRAELIEAEITAPAGRRTEVADDFERAEAQTDQLADRLRIDAERVAQQSALEARAARLAADLEELAAESARRADASRALDQEWQERWAKVGLPVRPPEELGSWRRDLDHLLERRAELDEARRTATRDRALRDEARSDLVQELEGLAGAFDASQTLGAGFGAGIGAGVVGAGAPAKPRGVHADRLEAWTESGEAHLLRLDEADEMRRRFDRAKREAEERALRSDHGEEAALRSLEAWRGEWRAALDGLELAADTRPNEARERLAALRDLMSQLREREQFADRVEKIGMDIQRFETDVRERVQSCAPDLVDFDAASAALRLQRMLSEGLEAEALARTSDESLAEAQEDLEEAVGRLHLGEEELERLREEASVSDVTEIDQALRIWRQVDQTLRERDEAIAQLEQLAEGRPIEELEEQSRELDPDVLVAQIEKCRAEVEEQAAQREAAIEKRKSARDALAAMDGGSAVAELSERAQAQLASVRRDVGRYVELRLAREILKAEIDRAREENQSPLLSSAGRILGGLTMGTYSSILSDEAADGRARLVAVDREGREKAVDALSEGTRDQLFLALRLAALQESFERTEPMPLIADDILVEFDDARTPAALEVLAELATKTQILLFSHHQFVADAAAAMGDRARIIEL